MTRIAGSFTAIPGWDGPDGMSALFERGDLLYEQFERGPTLVGGLALSAVLGVFGVIMILLGLLVTDFPAFDRAMGIFFGSMMVLLDLWFATVVITSMPFRVYTGGVTLPKVPLRDGLVGRETFVPVGNIKEVTWGTVPEPSGGSGFRFHLEKGEDFSVSVEDPEKITRLLFRTLWCPVEGPV